MNNVQLYFAIGIPTLTAISSLVIGLFQLNHTLTKINARFTSLESNMNTRFNLLENRFSALEQDMKTLVKVGNDLDVRLARLEERTRQ